MLNRLKLQIAKGNAVYATITLLNPEIASAMFRVGILACDSVGVTVESLMGAERLIPWTSIACMDLEVA